jgi:hypothetical protein
MPDCVTNVKAFTLGDCTQVAFSPPRRRGRRENLTAKGATPQTARGAGERKVLEILAAFAFFAVQFPSESGEPEKLVKLCALSVSAVRYVQPPNPRRWAKRTFEGKMQIDRPAAL